MPKHQSLLRRLLQAVFVLPAAILAQVAIAPAGSGTGADPYRIATLENLYWLSQTPDAWSDTIIQTDDIDASSTAAWDEGNGFMPIGDTLHAFSGLFNGKRHTIAGLTINRQNDRNVGLFGYSVGPARFDSIGLLDLSIRCRGINCGGLLGSGIQTTVYRCFATGRIDADAAAGGLAGFFDGEMDQCAAAVEIHGRLGLGGLVGQVGLVQTIIRNSYSTGRIYGEAYLGALIGATFHGRIEFCHAIGRVQGNSVLGGLIGISMSSAYNSSFWNKESILVDSALGSSMDDTLRASTGLTSKQMMNHASFDGWDFQNVWVFEQGQSYPTLQAFNLRASNSSTIHISSGKLVHSDTYPVEIYDLRGRRIWVGKAGWTGERWELPAIGPGIWILQARMTQGGVVHRTLILP